MNQRSSIRLPLAIVLLVASAAITAAVMFVDVQPIGLQGTTVGLATINWAVFAAIGQNELCDTLSDAFLLIAIAVCAAFLIGAVITAARRGLKKVDKSIYLFFGACIALLALYVLFEFVSINYRPVMEDGVLKASFPSSHTMAACGVFGCAAIAVKELFDSGKANALRAACIAAIVASVGLRMFSGCHWFTDVCAGFLFAMTIVALYALAIERTPEPAGKHARGKHAR